MQRISNWCVSFDKLKIISRICPLNLVYLTQMNNLSDISNLLGKSPQLPLKYRYYSGEKSFQMVFDNN